MRKLVAEIMAARRRAERLATALPEGSPERLAAKHAATRLSDALQELRRSGVAPVVSAGEGRRLLADAASDLPPDAERRRITSAAVSQLELEKMRAVPESDRDRAEDAEIREALAESSGEGGGRMARH